MFFPAADEDDLVSKKAQIADHDIFVRRQCLTRRRAALKPPAMQPLNTVFRTYLKSALLDLCGYGSHLIQPDSLDDRDKSGRLKNSYTCGFKF
jgi:hypothetical protein